MSKARDTSNDVAMTSHEFRLWLREMDMSVDEVAEMLGLTRQGVIYWVDGKRTIPEPIGRILMFLKTFPEMINKF